MAFKIENRKDRLEGTFSQFSFYNNYDHYFYALDSHTHENDGFPLIQVDKSIGDTLFKLTNKSSLTMKYIKDMWYYDTDTILAVCYELKSGMSFDVNLLYNNQLEKIRIDNDMVYLYFFME